MAHVAAGLRYDRRVAVTIEWSVEPEDRTRAMEEEARRIARELAKLGARKVILFGSRARGAARAGSDLDIMAVLPWKSSRTFAGRLAEVGELVDPRFATDLLVYTPDEFAVLAKESPFVREALAEGIVLFERGETASAEGVVP